MFHLRREFSVKQFPEVKLQTMTNLFSNRLQSQSTCTIYFCVALETTFLSSTEFQYPPFHFSFNFHCLSHRRMNFPEGLSNSSQSTAAIQVA